MTLVIMAAGMGSRFGGLKQVEPVGPNGEFILDYSVYDAIKAGYDKVVFIIKEENYNLFRKTVGKRIESKVRVDYVFQKIEDVPKGITIPSTRLKPWGTSHAILSCKNVVKEPFTVINADDFYGYEPYKKIKDFFDNHGKDNDYAMVGYNVKNTLTSNGAVKRGICTKNDDGYLTSLVETSVEETNGKIIATPLDDDEHPFYVTGDDLVSMNVWGFTPSIFNYLEDEMTDFFEKNKNNLERCEFLIPSSVSKRIKDKKVTVKVLETSERWYGITYKEDKKDLVDAIRKMIKEGKYPERLWD